jgi:hypothetical protein
VPHGWLPDAIRVEIRASGTVGDFESDRLRLSSALEGVIRSDSQSGDFDRSKHRGRICPQHDTVVSQASPNCSGIRSGSRVAPSCRCRTRLLARFGRSAWTCRQGSRRTPRSAPEPSGRTPRTPHSALAQKTFTVRYLPGLSLRSLRRLVRASSVLCRSPYISVSVASLPRVPSPRLIFPIS